MRNAGKLVIVAVVGVGLAAALFSLWYHRASGRHALLFWGPQTALLIAQAPEVEALQLRPADTAKAAANEASQAHPSSDEPIRRLGIGGHFYQILKAKDVSAARGISNIRRALVIDPPYDWDKTATDAPSWQYALEFRDGERTALALFDFDTGQLGSTVGDQTVVLGSAVRADWPSFFAEQFEGGSSE